MVNANNLTAGSLYAISATANMAVKRIRTPHEHDVLSGRGGGINSHVGNQSFREWVRVRKEDYNLAPSKADKAIVVNEVIAKVKALKPPGRFLQRDPTAVSGPGWWVELDDIKMMAKTSQALREGAPKIRAAHKDEVVTKRKTSRSKRSTPKAALLASRTTGTTNSDTSHNEHTQVKEATRRSRRREAEQHKPTTDTYQYNTTTTSTSVAAPPTQTQTLKTEPVTESSAKTLTPKSPLDAAYQQATKAESSLSDTPASPTTSTTALADRSNSITLLDPKTTTTTMVKASSFRKTPRSDSLSSSARSSKRVRMEYHPEDTPPLLPVPTGSENSVPPLNGQTTLPKSKRANATTSSNSSSGNLKRTNSLALSDIGSEVDLQDEPFVNPFEDETSVLDMNVQRRQIESCTSSSSNISAITAASASNSKSKSNSNSNSQNPQSPRPGPTRSEPSPVILNSDPPAKPVPELDLSKAQQIAATSAANGAATYPPRWNKPIRRRSSFSRRPIVSNLPWSQ